MRSLEIRFSIAETKMVKTHRDEKYGKVLAEEIVDENVSVAIIQDKKGDTFLDIRRIYIRNKKVTWGKGIRLPLEDDLAENVMMVAQNMLMRIEFE